MTADKPRRYVQVWTCRRPIAGRTWACAACGASGEVAWGQSLSALIASRAERHAAECPAVAAATERDRLAGQRDYYAARLDQRDAFAARVEQERDYLRAELGRMRTDRDRLRDRLTAINYDLRDATP